VTRRPVRIRLAADVFAYSNNGWEVFAPRNAGRPRKLVTKG
jgi:hypothetical protein